MAPSVRTGDGADGPPMTAFEGVVGPNGREGGGTMWYATGVSVRGTFRDDVCLLGVRREPGRLKYRGSFDAADMPHGQGKMNYCTGDKLQGLFEHGQFKCGFFTDRHGNWYRGPFHNHTFHGDGGVYYLEKSNLMWDIETWRNGLPAGRGALFLKDMEITGVWTDFFRGRDFEIFEDGAKIESETSESIAEFVAALQ